MNAREVLEELEELARQGYAMPVAEYRSRLFAAIRRSHPELTFSERRSLVAVHMAEVERVGEELGML